MRQNIRMTLVLLSSVWALVGCGGGGGSSTATTPSASLAKSVGTYNDSAVSGVSYVCGSESGTTDANGSFTYDVGSTCTFSLKGIVLSVIQSQLSEANATILVQDVTVAQFLQSIDLDGNASNGITISAETIATIANETNETNVTNINLTTIVAALQTAVVDYNGTEVNATAAAAHLEVTRQALDHTAPVIKVSGANPLRINQNTSFVPPVATAVDDFYGVTTVTVLSNTVNTATPGSYVVTYGSTDGAGNSATFDLNVTVLDVTAPVISLVGSNVSVELGTTYTDAGATAVDNVDGSITPNIAVTSTVNTNAVGTYTVTYNVSDAAGNAATPVTRTVTVTPDATAPVITLLGNSNVSIELGTTYTDAGATANDNIDGVLTLNIAVTSTVNTNVAGTYTVTYNVSDAAGNAATPVTRTVTVTPDVTPPVITLNGTDVTLYVGDTYIEANATALDNIDGDISANIVIVSTVNTTTEGNYTVTYNVADNANNAATEVVRHVTVLPVSSLAFTVPSTYYGSIYQDQNGTFSTTRFDFNVNQELVMDGLQFTNGVFVTGNANTNTDYVLDNGSWILSPNVNPFVLSAGGTVATFVVPYRATWLSRVNIAGTIVTIDGTSDTVTMPAGAERSTFHSVATADVYYAYQRVQTHGNTANTYYLTLTEVLQYQCGTRWFQNAAQGSGIQGISFTCGEENLTSGTLVGVGLDFTTLTPNVGTWQLITLPASTDRAIVVSINPAYVDQTQGNRAPMFAEKLGEIWRGSYEANGTASDDILYNQTAFNAIESKLAALSALANGTAIADLSVAIVGNTFYTTNNFGAVETIYFDINGTLSDSFDNNGTTQVVHFPYDVNTTTLHIYGTPDGNLTFTNGRNFATYAQFTDANGTETGRFFFTFADAQASLPAPVTLALISGKTFYDSGSDIGRHSFASMTITDTNVTRHEIWYYDANNTVSSDTTFTLPYALVNGKIKVDITLLGYGYKWFTLLSETVDALTMLEENDVNQDGIIDAPGSNAVWYKSKPVSFPASL